MTMKTCVELPGSLGTILVRLLSYTPTASLYARTDCLLGYHLVSEQPIYPHVLRQPPDNHQMDAFQVETRNLRRVYLT